MKYLSFVVLLLLACAAHARPGDIVDAAGAVNPAAYRAIGNAYSSPAAMQLPLRRGAGKDRRADIPAARRRRADQPLRRQLPGRVPARQGIDCDVEQLRQHARGGDRRAAHRLVGVGFGCVVPGFRRRSQHLDAAPADTVASRQAAAVRDGRLLPRRGVVTERGGRPSHRRRPVRQLGGQLLPRLDHRHAGQRDEGRHAVHVGNTTASNRASVQFPVGLVPPASARRRAANWPWCRCGTQSM